MKSRAQQWGETAVAFIASAAGTAIFAVLAYVLWLRVHSIALTCCVLAALCAIFLVYNSIVIVRWWFVLAKRDRR